MAKPKPKLLNPKKLRKLQKDKRLRQRLPLVLLGLGVMIGIGLAWLQPPNLHPKNLVWAADETVQLPGDLAEFLRLQDKCLGFRRTDAPRGVGLWSVYQLSHDKFAKIAYGCGVGLTRYVMAVKVDYKWQLLQPADYFAGSSGQPGGNGFLPQCAVIEKYQIDKSIEPFCIEATGSPRANTIP